MHHHIETRMTDVKSTKEANVLIMSGRHFKGACGLACAQHLLSKGCQPVISFLEVETVSQRASSHWDRVIDNRLRNLADSRVDIVDSIHELTSPRSASSSLPAKFDVVIDALWPLASAAREARFSPTSIAALHYLVSQHAPIISLEDPSDGVSPHGIISVMAPRTSWSTLMASSPPRFLSIVDIGTTYLKEPLAHFRRAAILDVAQKRKPTHA